MALPSPDTNGGVPMQTPDTTTRGRVIDATARFGRTERAPTQEENSLFQRKQQQERLVRQEVMVERLAQQDSQLNDEWRQMQAIIRQKPQSERQDARLEAVRHVWAKKAEAILQAGTTEDVIKAKLTELFTDDDTRDRRVNDAYQDYSNIINGWPNDHGGQAIPDDERINALALAIEHEQMMWSQAEDIANKEIETPNFVVERFPEVVEDKDIDARFLEAFLAGPDAYEEVLRKALARAKGKTADEVMADKGTERDKRRAKYESTNSPEAKARHKARQRGREKMKVNAKQNPDVGSRYIKVYIIAGEIRELRDMRQGEDLVVMEDGQFNAEYTRLVGIDGKNGAIDAAELAVKEAEAQYRANESDEALRERFEEAKRVHKDLLEKRRRYEAAHKWRQAHHGAPQEREQAWETQLHGSDKERASYGKGGLERSLDVEVGNLRKVLERNQMLDADTNELLNYMTEVNEQGENAFINSDEIKDLPTKADQMRALSWEELKKKKGQLMEAINMLMVILLGGGMDQVQNLVPAKAA